MTAALIEAFAVVAEKFICDLSLDRDKVNVNGGIVLFHVNFRHPGESYRAVGLTTVDLLRRYKLDPTP